MKTCSTCGVEKPLSEFYASKSAKSADGHMYRCKQCSLAANKKYRDANLLKIALRKMKAYHTPSKFASAVEARFAPEQTKEEMRKKRIAENKERTAVRRRAYQQRNLADYAYRNAIRHASKINATPEWANKFFIQEAYRLARLRTQKLGFAWHVDHIVPLQSELVCGLHVEHNLRVIPAAENYAKGNRYWPDMPA